MRFEVSIGRGPASAIRLDHSWLSRTHVRLRAEDNRWIMVDCSANGMYIDTERHESVVVTDGLAVQLGRPDGLTVRFTYAHADQPDEITDDPADPDIARAGAAVAARRRYDAVMARAAEAPDAPLGRRLYTVRRRANLTVEDAALAAALPVGVVESLEEDQPVAAHVIAAIEELVTQLDT